MKMKFKLIISMLLLLYLPLATANEFNLPISWILTNDGTSIDQNNNGYPDYADNIYNLSDISINNTENLNSEPGSYYLNYDNMNSGSISSIYIDDSSYWDNKSGTGICPDGYYVNGTNITGVICEMLPTSSESNYTAGNYLYLDSDEFNVNNTELNDNILIKYQNITNIPTCTANEKLIYNGTDLICDNDKEGTNTDDQTLSVDSTNINDTITIENGNTITIDDNYEPNTNTQLTESEVEGYINGDEISFDGWDKNSSDEYTKEEVYNKTEILAFDYYNSSDFNISDYYTSTQVNNLPISTFSNDAGYITNYNDYIDFNTSYTDGIVEGRLQWDPTDGTLEIGMPGESIRLQIGQEVLQRVRNDESVQINNGQLVYISGSTGDRVNVKLADCRNQSTSFVLGMVTENISNNQFGYVTMEGLVRNLNTLGLDYGVPIWLGEDGSYTQTRPLAPCYSVFIGYVVRKHATDGIIAVRPTLVPTLKGLSDVYNNRTLLSGEFPVWNATTGYFDFDYNANDFYTNETIISSEQVQMNQDFELNDWYNTVQSAGRVSGGKIIDNGDGTVHVNAGKGIIKNESSSPSDGENCELEGCASISENHYINWSNVTSLSLTNKAYNYIYYDGSSDSIEATTNFYAVDFTQDFTVGRVYREDTEVTIRLCGTNLWNFNRRIQLFGEERFPIERAQGMVIGSSGLNISITNGILWAELVNRFIVESFDSSNSSDNFTYYYRNGTGGFTEIQEQSQIDNTNYDDGTGTLAELTPNRYGVHWVYEIHDSQVGVVYGRGDYKLAEAQNANPPGSLPGLLNAYATLVGKIIIQKNAVTTTETLSPFTTTFSSSVVQNHNDLANIQGGTSNEYYHLTSPEYSELQSGYILESEESNLGVNSSNSTNYWDNLNTESDLTPSNFLTAGDYISYTGNTLNVLDNWYDSISDLPTNTISDGDTTHIANNDQIHTFVIGQGYITDYTVTSSDVGSVSNNLDNIDASVEWEDAGGLDSSGNVLDSHLDDQYIEQDGSNSDLDMNNNNILNNNLLNVQDWNITQQGENLTFSKNGVKKIWFDDSGNIHLRGNIYVSE